MPQLLNHDTRWLHKNSTWLRKQAKNIRPFNSGMQMMLFVIIQNVCI